MLPAFTAVFSTGLLLGSYLPYFPLLTTVLLIGCALFPSAVERVPVRFPRGGVGLYAALLLGLLYWHGFAWIAPAVPIPDEHKSPAPDVVVQCWIDLIQRMDRPALDRFTRMIWRRFDEDDLEPLRGAILKRRRVLARQAWP